MKKQGYNSRLDDSLGSKHKGSHSQSMKSRRDESKAMDKKTSGHAYGVVDKSVSGKKVKSNFGMKYEKTKKVNTKNIRK
tara:strand:- start:644 stop:880 length:237 start_codon:yes stop_codon:yes gene_type:complete